MTTQNYFMVNQQTNICENTIVWDGDQNTWTPPAGYLMLVQATTFAKLWAWNAASNIWELVPAEGAGNIGFTWDGSFLVTNEPEPAPPVQPVVTGAQAL